MIRFIHAADIHLDSPLKGLANRHNLPTDKILAATRDALVNLVTLAIDQKVDFVLLAGDIYDGDPEDLKANFHFNQQMGRLNQKNIKVVMITGNHDAKSKISKPLSPPKNLTILSAHQPESYEIIKEGEVIAIIHGQGFLNQAETRNLAGTYPAPVAGKLNIGILHTSLDGREGHANYAPTTTNELINKGYSYWALGHIHTREVVHQKPYIIFPGNIQGRHIRETGAKGCYLVTFNDNSEAQLEFKPLDVFRWEAITVNLDGIEEESEFEGKLAETVESRNLPFNEIPHGIRIILKGNTSLHSWLICSQNRISENIQGIFDGISAGNLFLEQIKVETSNEGPALKNEALGDDALSILDKAIKNLKKNPKELETLLKETPLAKLNREIPGEWKAKDDTNAIQPMNAAWLDEIFDELVPLIQTIAKNEDKK
ncbi:MAG: DNA repair exonuclease [Planctomycetota bacterium]|nr:MAG: DNA repair exonuclease [Planctomycetota bacterium]